MEFREKYLSGGGLLSLKGKIEPCCTVTLFVAEWFNKPEQNVVSPTKWVSSSIPAEAHIFI